MTIGTMIFRNDSDDTMPETTVKTRITTIMIQTWILDDRVLPKTDADDALNDHDERGQDDEIP